MAKQSSTQTDATPHNAARQDQTRPSALTKFNLSFEYDRSWSEAKQLVQHRPSKN